MFIEIFPWILLGPKFQKEFSTNLVQNSCKTSKMCSYVQEFFKNQYTSYLNKIEQYYKKNNLKFPIFLKNVRPTVLILIFTIFLYQAWGLAESREKFL